jgi:hypothetical protein
MNVEQLAERKLPWETEVLRKRGVVPLRPQKISHDLTWDGTRAAVVGS